MMTPATLPLLLMMTHTLAGSSSLSLPPLNDKVYHHLISQFSEGHAMFQHFGVSTFGANNPYGVGGANDCWHGATTKPDAVRHPCLPAKLFNPQNYSATQTMEVAKAFGASEVCITAHHEGGFTLWPSNHSEYGVKASAWKDGKGDILKEFAAAARDAGIKICYYIGPNANGYMLSKNYTAERFISAQLGEFTELLTHPDYGPVHRFWIDHPWQTCHNYSDGSLEGGDNPRYTACPPLDQHGKQTFPMAQLQFDALVNKLSPSTIMGGSEYWNGPTRSQYPFWYYCNRSFPTIPNSGCWSVGKSKDECSDTHDQFGDSFRPIEITGSAIGGWFGPLGDKERMSATDMWKVWMSSVGVGGGWIMNLPPTVTGHIPDDWAAPAMAFGQALKESFSEPVAVLLSKNTSVECGPGAAPLELPIPETVQEWNAVRSAEDVYHDGQRVVKYAIEALVGTKWRNATSRGGTVGVGTVDMHHPNPGESTAAQKLRWRCIVAAGGAQAVTLTAIDLYLAVPPT